MWRSRGLPPNLAEENADSPRAEWRVDGDMLEAEIQVEEAPSLPFPYYVYPVCGDALGACTEGELLEKKLQIKFIQVLEIESHSVSGLRNSR